MNVVLCSSEEDRETVSKAATLAQSEGFLQPFLYVLCSLFLWSGLKWCFLLEPTRNISTLAVLGCGNGGGRSLLWAEVLKMLCQQKQLTGEELALQRGVLADPRAS